MDPGVTTPAEGYRSVGQETPGSAGKQDEQTAGVRLRKRTARWSVLRLQLIIEGKGSCCWGGTERLRRPHRDKLVNGSV
ncbi:unnamed protein product [Caretta caretta]